MIVPYRIDEPVLSSGGNRYDRRICAGLTESGWQVREHAVPGGWPRPAVADVHALDRVVAGLPDGALVLADGLIASCSPQVFLPAARRLTLIVLVHLPLGGPPAPTTAWSRESAVLGAARAVITTSAWTRARLLEWDALSPAAVHVAEPGVDRSELATGTAAGGALLCVANVTRGKGHHVLLAALASLRQLPWQCVCVGGLDRDAEYVAGLRRHAATLGIGGRVRFTGLLGGRLLDRAYRRADVLVHPSLGETYGMVVTEALARGVPVIATAAGGLPEALGTAGDGRRPGVLVAPGDAQALAGALSDWLTDADLRCRLRDAARARRSELPCWSTTTEQVERVLRGVNGR